MPQFTEVLPYEGAFTYSIKHDENEQPTLTSHGELQLLNERRVVGDLTARSGLDVNGVNDSGLNGYIDLKNTADGTSVGLGVNSAAHFVAEQNDEGADVESFTGSVALTYRDNGEDGGSLVAAVDGTTTTDGDTFATSAGLSLTLSDEFKLNVNATLEQADYEEIEFAGGQAIDLTALNDDQLSQIKSEVTKQGREALRFAGVASGRAGRSAHDRGQLSALLLKEGDSFGAGYESKRSDNSRNVRTGAGRAGKPGYAGFAHVSSAWRDFAV